MLPEWHLKQEAEARRAGVSPEIDIRRRMHSEVRREVEAGKISHRGGLISFLESRLAAECQVIHRVGPDFITIGPQDAPAKCRSTRSLPARP